MIREKVIIKDEKGLHMRPAKDVSKIAADYSSRVKILHKNCEYNAKSLIGLLGAGIKSGSEIEIVCDGVDEKEALAKVTEYFKRQL